MLKLPANGLNSVVDDKCGRTGNNNKGTKNKENYYSNVICQRNTLIQTRIDGYRHCQCDENDYYRLSYNSAAYSEHCGGKCCNYRDRYAERVTGVGENYTDHVKIVKNLAKQSVGSFPAY